MNDKGNPVSKAYTREQAQVAIDDFVAARESGKEAYLYAKPVPDKRSKSIEDQDATNTALGN